jgi:sulfate adenylyltransferase subunit 1 (EFTu-like GTPase family)
LAIVGHVDHGKSTLIGRILLDTHSLSKDKLVELNRVSKELGKETQLAFLVDQLKEEREQEKTIDTTQTFFKTLRRRYCLIDAPGHTEFIKNMITAASHAHATVLIIAADAGIMEQTKRHAYLIKMLGIDRLITVFNKMDMVHYDEKRFKILKDEISSFLDRLGLKAMFNIPVSAKDDVNVIAKSNLMPWYEGPSLLKALDSINTETRDSGKPLRFSVQDIYNHDSGDIVVGRVESGEVRKGDRITALPSHVQTKVNQVVFFGNRFKSKAEAGENPGLILDNPSSIKRGNVLVSDKTSAHLSDRFQANVFWLSPRPLESGGEMTLSCATQEVTGTAESIERRMNSSTLEIIQENADRLETNEAAAVVFKTKASFLIEKFSFIEPLGRFIIESGLGIEGVGIVTWIPD